jgi:hypothetical protein
MKSRVKTFHLLAGHSCACLLMSAVLPVTEAKAIILGVGRTETTRAQAIAIVRQIINQKKAACKINKIRSLSAVRSRGGWRITAKLVMSASGRPLNETAVWTVRADGQATPANQLTAELTNGCP